LDFVENRQPPSPRHNGIPTGKIPLQRAFPAPRRPHVAPLEVLLGKGLPLRSCTSASRARGAYKKRLGPHSPIIGFHYRSDQPRRRHTDRLPKDKPSTPFVYFGLTGARGLQETSRPSLTDHRLPLPGRPAHPASPHLSPRLRQSPRTWKATRLRLNPTASASAVPPREEGRWFVKHRNGSSSNRDGMSRSKGPSQRNKGQGAQRHPHRQNPDAKGIPRPAQASCRALGSAPREGPPTPFVYFGLRARGAYKKRLGPHSPIIGFHYRSDQPRRRHTDRLPKDKPSTPFVYFGLTGARGLQETSRPSLTDHRLPLPGRPAHPASPHLSPRLRQSPRTWKATRLRLNPTASASAVPPRDEACQATKRMSRCKGAMSRKKGRWAAGFNRQSPLPTWG